MSASSDTAEDAASEVQKNVFKVLPVGQNDENTTVGRYALKIM